MALRCKPGDLAVIVTAYHRSNIGTIVRVLATHSGTGDLVINDMGHAWLIKASRRIRWVHTGTGKKWRRTTGPMPDCQLQPIRGVPEPESLRQERTRETTE